VLDKADRDKSMMAALAKGLAVIEVFGADRPKLTIAEVARLADMERATARRCLLTLVRLGYAAHDGKFFALLPRIMRLGHAYLATTPLPALVQPFLERLSADVSESASVSILDGAEILYVARAVQRRVVSINLGVGSRLPAYCASMGRVLLAALPVGEAEALLTSTERSRLTEHTLTGIDELMGELARVRAAGYAIVDQELEIGLRSVAVPILRADGTVVAALNVGAQASRLSVADIERALLPRMRAIQAELRSLLP
jgi:IclR family transcriptional regulator, pca regulon regulatory protein